MKNKIKTVLCMLLILAMGLSLCACGGREPEKEKTPAPEAPKAETEEKELAVDNVIELNYAAEVIEKPEGIKWINKMTYFEDIIYLLGEDRDRNKMLFSSPMENTQWTELNFQMEPVSEESFFEINGLLADENGIYMTCNGWDEENGEYFVLRAYDRESGEKKEEYKLEEIDGMFQPQWLMSGDRLICVSEGMAKMVKTDGTTETLAEEGVHFAALIQDRLLICMETGGENALMELVGEAGELKKLCVVKDEFKPYTDYASYISDGPVILTDRECVKAINTETGDTEELLNWHDIGTAMSMGAQSLYVTEKNEMYLLDSGIGPGHVCICKVYPHEGGIRKELVVSTGAGVGGIYTYDAIAKFNRENGEYVIREKVYSQEDADKILTEIIAGDGPDVFYIGSTTDRESAFTRVNPGNNLFVDLMPYIESDPDIKKDDFLPGVLESMTVDGHIYAMHPAIQAISIVAPKEFANGIEKWDMDKLAELQANLPEGYSLFRGTPEAMMEYLCQYASIHFINRSEGTCSFDDPDFASWLELIKNTEPYDWDNSAGYALGMCYAGHNEPRMSRETFGDYEYIGFPSSDDGINYLLSSVGGYSIMADSENKDAAWEYIKILLSYEIQDRLCSFGYPVMEKSFDECMKKEMSSEYGMDVKEQDAVKLKAVIASSAGMGEMNAVSDIIMEEAQKYFADQKPLEETVQMIQSRASIYLAEQKQ